MAATNQPQPFKPVKSTGPMSRVLDALLALEDGLTKWEADFIDSLAKQREDWEKIGLTFDRRISRKQEELLHRVSRKLL